jgi:demethylmenaquinone methyltransferase/2-methoxy-6-polyprenyl-1,4-benzoquinol methylase
MTKEVILSDNSNVQTGVANAYQKRSKRYDIIVKIFDLFRSYGFDIEAWRETSIYALNLEPGNTVVDIGCGTGLTFAYLHEGVGPEGKIIGVDLSSDMLDQARQRIREHNWKNVELVCADATEYTFPKNVDAILSNFALILIPNCGQVVANACQALKPGGRLSILDMAWPDRLSLRWWRLLFWLPPLGLTRKILENRPWESVWKAMEENLMDVTLKRFWYGFMYQTSGSFGNDR